MRKHKYMFWVDLETTGSRLETNEIIEIGVAITDTDLNVVETENLILPVPDGIVVNDFVKEMHTVNGLWEDCAKSTLTKGEADKILADMIRFYNGSDHMLLAGSGVMHFDRQFIKRDLPLTNDRLSYYAIDVGVDRRNMELILGEPDPHWPQEEGNKTHRALDDILFHIKENQYARNLLKVGWSVMHGG